MAISTRLARSHLCPARADAARLAAGIGRGAGFGTDHLSLYQLTIEAGTPFAVRARTGEQMVPDEDSAAALFELTQEMTEAAGRPAYESPIMRGAARNAVTICSTGAMAITPGRVPARMDG